MKISKWPISTEKVVSNPNPNPRKTLYFICKYCFNSINYTKIYEIVK